MRIKFGTLIVGARGTIGGATLSANGSGPYAKTWSRSANPRTDKQSERRSQFSIIAPRWQDLTSGQRDDWNTYAAASPQELTNSLGETYFASGFNWFISTNAIAAIGGFADQTTAPVVPRPAQPTLSTFNVTSAPNLNVTYPTDEFVSNRIQISLAKEFSAGVLSKTYDYKWIKSNASPGTTQEFFIAAGVAAFGAPQIGDRYYVRVTAENGQNRRSPIASLATTVTS